MTSKNLSFKLMAEDLKRRVWTIALTVLALIFAQIFPIAVKCSEYAEQAGKWNESTREYMETNILSLLMVNPMAAAVLIGAAVLWAVTSFCYLHNSKKVDFYHSIPVKRHVLYIANLGDSGGLSGIYGSDHSFSRKMWNQWRHSYRKNLDGSADQRGILQPALHDGICGYDADGQFRGSAAGNCGIFLLWTGGGGTFHGVYGHMV